MGGINVKNTIVESFLQKVAPHPCFGCEKIGTVVCDNCKYNIISEPFSGCIVCGNISTIGICAHHDVPICKAWVVGERVTVLKRVIDAYKFEYVKGAADTLVAMLDESLPEFPPEMLIVPVPTAPSHIRQRGYDHIRILARKLSIERDLAIAPLLERSSNTTQHRLKKNERVVEAKAAFHIKQGTTVDPDTPLLILDDIITTGSTVCAAAQILREAGAKYIFVATLAYQPLD